MRGHPRRLDELMPTLIRVHERLDADMNLDALATLFGYSPFHFHRVFATAVGETPKQHVDRVRLERARYLLAVTDLRVLEIGLDLGFKSHETFTRAFKRFTGTTPVRYRRTARQAQADRLKRNQDFRGDGCRLSDVDFVMLPAVPLLAIRRLGSYDSLPVPFSSSDTLWPRMVRRAREAGVPVRHEAWVISYDDPTVTPADQQRLDACMPAGAMIEEQQQVRCLPFPGGRYGRIRHLGPLDSVSQAYSNLADGIRRSDAFVFDAGPPLQIFRAIRLAGDPDLNHTEIYFPVRRRQR